MDAPMLLIADSDPEFCQALTEALDGRFPVHCCCGGREALSLLRSLSPDILVLDLMLPELDGITVLQLSQEDGLHPRVLALTSIENRYIADSADRLGIDYTMRKPCEVSAVALRLEDLLTWEDRRYIQGLLAHLGFSKDHDALRFLPDAVAMMHDNPRQSVTKELYPAVGKRSVPRESAAKVEKDIRSAINLAWEQRDKALWEKYVPPGPKPTNRKFLLYMAQALGKWKAEKRLNPK